MEWINIESELPNIDGVYMVYAPNPYTKSQLDVRLASWHVDRFINFPSGATVVTHWMPLPEPPEKEL